MVGSVRRRRAIARVAVGVGMGVVLATVGSLPAGAARSAPTAGGPDYVITSVNEPPAKAARGDSFPALDTTTNNGDATSVTSQNLYYLSLDQVVDASDTVLGGRGVLGLGAGASNSSGLNAHVPAAMPLGRYYVLTCADGSNNIAESNETNNCVSSTKRVTIVMPDYVETSVDNPPTSAQRGTAFVAGDTVQNIGKGGTSTTAYTNYYLSKNFKKDAHDPLVGGRGYLGLAAGASNSGGLNAHVPSETLAGYYYVLACADDFAQVDESNETNNCAHSATQMLVTVPDFMVTSVTDPRATATRSSVISISDVVHNAGSAAVASSTNAYYLSHDNIVDGSDYQFSETTEVSALPGGATAFDDDVALTVPASTKFGMYKVIVCADSTNVLAESHEANNCRASTGKVQIVPASRPAALIGHHGVR